MRRIRAEQDSTLLLHETTMPPVMSSDTAPPMFMSDAHAGLPSRRPRKTPIGGAGPPPLWIHSSWRVSSTWLWWRFRQLPHVLAYAEVFHETLATLTPQALANFRPSAWDSGHPHAAAYFLEYAPLLDDGLGFRPPMSYHHFLPAGANRCITEAEAAYLENLIGLAHRLGKTPVVTGVRTLGRVYGLRHRFGGYHVMLYRNLFRQWCSYSSQALKGNPYFMQRTDIVLKHARHDRFLAELTRIYPPAARDEQPCRRWNDFVRFAMLHLYLYALALPDCDLDIEIDRLAADRRYRQQIETAIADAADLAVDLSGCRASIGVSALPMNRQQREAIEAIRVLARQIPAYLSHWSERQQAVLDGLIDGLEEECERYAFYTRELSQHALRSPAPSSIPDAAAADSAGSGMMQAVTGAIQASDGHQPTEEVVAAVQDENERLSAALEAVLRSASWRLTRPARALKRMFPTAGRRLRPSRLRLCYVSLGRIRFPARVKRTEG